MSDTVEIKQLIKLNERFLNIAKTTHAFRNNLKALKVCQKLIDIEIKTIKKSKLPLNPEQTDKILWRYIDLRNTIKYLVKTKEISEINKGCVDIESMISLTERQIAELNGVNTVGSISAASQKIVTTIGDTAQKIGDAVNEKINGLKKIFAVDENLKSE